MAAQSDKYTVHNYFGVTLNLFLFNLLCLGLYLALQRQCLLYSGFYLSLPKVWKIILDPFGSIHTPGCFLPLSALLTRYM